MNFKKSAYILLCFLFCLSGFEVMSMQEQDSTKKWALKNSIIFSSEQTALSNWSAGGYSSLSFSAFYKGFYNYKRGKNQWDNSIELAYGLLRQDVTGKGLMDKGNIFQKSDDKIELNSIFGRQLYKYWNYSGLLNMKSQFDEGFKDSVLVSAPFSPMTFTTSVGFEYKRKSFSLLLSFLTGKTVVVCDNRLKGSSLFGFSEPNQSVYFSVGPYIKFFYQKDIFKNVNLLAKLDFYFDYSKPSILDTDISAEIFLNLKVTKYLTAFISLQAIMDKDFNSTLQYKERMGISIPLNF